MNQFSFKLLQQLDFGTSGRNEVFSPLSVHQLMVIALGGMRGESASQLSEALAITDLAKESEKASSFLRSLAQDEGRVLDVANGIWIRPPMTLNPEFERNARSRYQAQVSPLSLDNAEAVNQVNEWVKSKTRERIERLFDRFNDREKLVLVNALAFDGKWKKPFAPRRTAKHAFRAGEDELQVDMMSLSLDAPYAEWRGRQAVRLDYEGDAYGMVVVLPRQGESLGELVEDLNAQAWTELLRSMNSRQGSVKLPKFRFNAGYSLVEPMRELGARRMFAPNFDFTFFQGERVEAYVGQIAHKAFIETDEEGTKAAAATGMTVGVTSLPVDPPFQFVADRPFFFAIVDIRSQEPLFLGTVVRP